MSPSRFSFPLSAVFKFKAAAGEEDYSSCYPNESPRSSFYPAFAFTRDELHLSQISNEDYYEGSMTATTTTSKRELPPLIGGGELDLPKQELHSEFT